MLLTLLRYKYPYVSEETLSDQDILAMEDEQNFCSAKDFVMAAL